MNQEITQTLIRFTGDWPTILVVSVAFVLAVIMFFYYRIELRRHEGKARWVPALLRALAVFLVVLALAAPVLRRETTFRQLGRVVVVADASASMSFTDNLESGMRNAESASKKTATPNSPDSRFSRIERVLFAPVDALMNKLAEHHDVELFALRGYKAERLWWRRENGADTSGELPQSFGFRPDATITNLDQPLRDALGPSPAGTALVVLTDGQHNAPGSPEDLASSLRDSGIPIFTVGYGSEVPPPDIALLNVIAPEAVFSEDRAEGVIVMQDTMPAGLPGMASISYLNKVLWQQAFTTTGGGERRFEFAFPVKDLTQANATQTMRLLTFKTELTGTAAAKDRIAENNSRVVALHLLSRKRKVLILDGRARWETRYLKNHFERDERWQVTAAFDDFSNGANGTIENAFPKKKEDLMSYDLIVLGDLRPDAITPEQQTLMAEFVEKRGGGIILVDGRRGHLAQWAQSKAGALLPVKWTGAAQMNVPLHYALTQQGQALEGLRLSDSASTNTAQWKKLPPAFWSASAEPLPAATVVAEVVGTDKKTAPAIVWRRFGAGSVLWLGTDEFWRWRYEVADMHHQRFWMQLASWIAAPPFLAENKRLAIGTDRLRYQEGDTAEVRVSLRDEKGSIVSDAKPRAHVFRNGIEVASLELEPDPTHGGVFRAITGALAAGDYQISVSEGSAPASDLRLAFRAESQANQEWAQLTMNRPLLEAMARNSGGRFLREGDIAQLPDLLQMLDRQETRVSESNLWSSWWWFGAVIALLSIEWLLRKKWRLV